MKVIRYLNPEGEMRFAQHQEDGPPLAIINRADHFEVTDQPAEVSRQLFPVDLRMIYGVGLNYRAHAEETGKSPPDHPMIFMKPVSSLLDPGGDIILPRKLTSSKVDFEGELAVIIGKECKNVSRGTALDYVSGYTIANDVSARDWQFEWGGGQFCRAKGFDTFCPLGPCLVTPDEIPDPSGLRVVTKVNGEMMQDGNTSDMIFDVPALIEFLSGSTTLLPGTAILTGTPSGVGHGRKPRSYLQPADRVEITIEGIGTLSNPVVEESI